MRTVVVTGANGFIGQYCLSSLLQQGFRVHALSTQRSGVDRQGVIWHKLNLLENSAHSLLRHIQPTDCLHLAWCTEHGKFWTDPANHQWLEVSKRLLEDFCDVGGKRFVNAGSCAEYTWGGECVEHVTNETPATLYGQCKKVFSDTLAAYNAAGKIGTANGRVFFLYGPGESPNRIVPAVISSFLSNTAPRCTDGLQKRDFMFVSDVAGGLVALLQSEVTGIVNIATGHAVLLRDLITMIAEMTKATVSPTFGVIPRGSGDPDLLLASAKRLQHEVGYRPKVDLDEGLSLTIEWVKSIHARGERHVKHS